MLTFMLHIAVKPGFEAVALETLNAIERDAHQDRGCNAFSWLQSRDEPYRFTLVEQWKDQGSLDAHLAKNPDRWNRFVPCLDGEPRSESFRSVPEMGLQPDEEEITAFAQQWFDKLDRHVDVTELLPMISDDGLEMAFPERVLRNKDEFSEWYDHVSRAFSNEEHEIEELSSTEGEDFSEVNVKVLWKAEKVEDGSRLAYRATQNWILRRSFFTGQPVIVKYTVQSLDRL